MSEKLKNIQIETDFPENLFRVKLDETGIQQIIMNLFTNARDAMPEGGQITLETRNVGTDELENLPNFRRESSCYIEIKITSGDKYPLIKAITNNNQKHIVWMYE